MFATVPCAVAPAFLARKPEIDAGGFGRGTQRLSARIRLQKLAAAVLTASMIS